MPSRRGERETYSRAIDEVDAKFRPLVERHDRLLLLHFTRFFGLGWVLVIGTVYLVGRTAAWVIAGFRERPL
jgi:hypothetical protein